MQHVLLDHSIVGQSLTTLSIRKDRELAACRICGAIFQSYLNTSAVSDEEYTADPLIEVAAHIETVEWRRYHNTKHSEKEHLDFRKSGRTLTPIAAQRLAPFGLISLDTDDETTCALLESKRLPADDVENALKPGIQVPKNIGG